MTDTSHDFIAPDDEDLANIPDPNSDGNMIGEVLPNDWTPEQ